MTFRKRNLLVLILGLAGCATVPREREPLLWWEFLPQAPILVYGKMEPIRDYLVEKTVGEDEFHDIFRRTTEFYASVVPGKESRFALMGLGDFPRGLIHWALGWNQSWRRGPEPPEQFIHIQAGLAVTVPEDGVVLASNTAWEGIGVAEPVRSVTGDAAQRALASDLFLYMPRPGAFLLGEVGERLSLVAVLVPLTAGDSYWDGNLEFVFENERQARLALVLIRLSALRWMDALGEWGIQMDPAFVKWSLEGSHAVVGPLRVPFSALDSTLALIQGRESE